jgi:AraC family transcriptional regulator
MAARIADDGLDVDRLPTHTVAINVGRPFWLEGHVEGRRCDAHMMRGTIKIVPAGPSSRWRWRGSDPIEMLHISVSAADLRAHVRELEIRREPEILTRVGIEDAPLLELARGFAGELAAHTAGSLAADALRMELLLRLLADHSSLAGSGAIRLPSNRLGMRVLRHLDEYIDAHLGADFGVADLAMLAGMSRFHFARTFKATTGATPYRYILERRVERARTLLQRSRLSIADIAAATGFADQSHLTRNFRERYGVTPHAYRAGSTNLLERIDSPIVASD